MKKLKNKKVIAIVLGFMAVSTIAIFLSDKKRLQEKEKVLTALILTECPIDSENDGVYTNYKYGYRFKYPVDKFEIKYSNKEGSGWESINLGAEAEKGKVILEVVGGGHNADFYKEALLVEDNAEWLPGIIKISSEDNEFALVKVFGNTPSRSEDKALFYAAYFIRSKEKPFVIFSVATNGNNLDVLRNYESVFEEIVDSFEFID